MSQIIEQAEALRQQAIGLLVADRQDIDRKLAMLGYDGTAPTVPAKSKSCSVCGSPEHNARFHKTGAPESAASIPPM